MTTRMNRWAAIHAVCLLIAVAWALSVRDVRPLLLTAIASFLISIVLFYPVVKHLRPPGGLPNMITTLRLAAFITCLFFVGSLDPYVFTACIVVVLIADGLDGFLARKLGQSTVFGALFDMEVDAFIGCALAVTGYFMFDLSEAVIAAGVLRYIFVLFVRLMRWTDRKVVVPGARTFAILFFISLLTPFVFGASFGYWATIAGSMLVFYSFGRETILLAGQGRQKKSRT